MLLPHNKVSGGVQDSQIMIPSFFDRFYVMPPLTNGVHYNNYGANHVRVKGHLKVLCHLMFGVLVLTVKQIFNYFA